MTYNFLVNSHRLQMQSELCAYLLMEIISFTDKFGCFCPLNSICSDANYGVGLCLADK